MTTDIGSLVLQLGVGGIFAVLVLYLVFQFVLRMKTGGGKPKNGKGDVTNMDLLEISKKIKKGTENNCTNLKHLVEIHDVRDSKGQYIWYNGDLLEQNREQTQVLKEILKEFRKK